MVNINKKNIGFIVLIIFVVILAIVLSVVLTRDTSTPTNSTPTTNNSTPTTNNSTPTTPTTTNSTPTTPTTTNSTPTTNTTNNSTPTTNTTTNSTSTSTSTDSSGNNVVDVDKLKFSKGEVKNTIFNDESSNNIFLDRHDVDCSNNGISRFQLVRSVNSQGFQNGLFEVVGSATNKFRYDYICSSGGNLRPISSAKNTQFNDNNGSLVFLDRHNVECENNSVLSRFKLITEKDTSKIRYDYTCRFSNNPLICRVVKTTVNERDDAGNTVFLDRHDVRCDDDEVLSQFKLVNLPDEVITLPPFNIRTNKPSKKIQYEYKCCKHAEFGTNEV
jgi:hypothetical protein